MAKKIGVMLCVAVFLLVSVSFAQDKVSIDRKDWNEYRIAKIQQELNQINADLRKKNPAEFKKMDELVAEAQKIQQEAQKAAPKK